MTILPLLHLRVHSAPRARRQRLLHSAVAGVLVATACADRLPLAASSSVERPVRLSLVASVDAAAAGRQVDVHVYYTRVPAGRVTLANERFDVDTGARALELMVDIASCLRDPDRVGRARCPLSATVTLRDPVSGPVDSVTVGPVNITGAAADSIALPVASLTRTARIRLVADSVRVHAGDTLSVSANAVDAAGNPLPSRPVTWTSADPSVATVTSNGIVAGLRVGQTALIASREGQTTTVHLTVPVKGVQRWVVGERLGVIGNGGPVYSLVTGVLPRGGSPTVFSSFGSQACRLAGGTWGCTPVQAGFSGSGFYPLRADAAWLSGYGSVAKYVDGALQVIPINHNWSYDAVWGDDRNNVVAVGAQGAIAQYDGTTWTREQPRTGVGYLHGVWGSSPTNVHVVGDSGVVLHWNGQSWTRSQLTGRPDPSARLEAIWGADSTHVYAAGGWGMTRMHDGQRWVELPTAGFWNVAAIHGTGPSDVYVIGTIDSVYALQRWDGARWTQLATVPAPPASVYAEAPGKVYVTGYDGYAALYEGGQLTTLSMSPDYGVISVASPTHAVIGGRVAFQRFDGTRWNPLPLPWSAPSFGHPQGVWTSGPNEIYASFSASRSFVRRFNGAGWTQIAAAPNNWSTFGRIVGLGAGDILVAAHRWDGANWWSHVERCGTASCSSVTPEFSGYVNEIWASSPTNAFVLSWIPDDAATNQLSHYVVMRWDGRAWSRGDLPANVFANGVWGLDSATVLASASGTGGGVFKYDYASRTWRQLPGTTSTGPVWGTAFDDLYVAACGNVRWYNGRYWRNVPTGGGCMLRIAGLRGGGAIATAQASTVLYGVGPDESFSMPSAAPARGLFSLLPPGLLNGTAVSLPSPHVLPPRLQLPGRGAPPRSRW